MIKDSRKVILERSNILPNVTASNSGLPNSKLLNHQAVVTSNTGFLKFTGTGVPFS